MQPPPLSLYVHLPWCEQKCPYCDFNSYPLHQLLPQSRYTDALLEDLASEAPGIQGRTIRSIFFGGGTPSLFSADSIARVLDAVRETVMLSPTAEITLEANPGSAEAGKFKAFRCSGINRLSIGVQSFTDDLLTRIGRIHNAHEARRAVEVAHHAGFENINIDLMYGLPGQTVDQAMGDLEAACSLSPTHVSWYQLTLEPNTVFGRDRPDVPGEEHLWRMHLAGMQLLRRNGFRRYEISAWAKPGYRCQHNGHYWRFGDYLGIGAGAHSKLTGSAGVVRHWKKRLPRAYMAASVQADGRAGGVSTLGSADIRFEFLMNALRLVDGFAPAHYERFTGLSANRLAAHLGAVVAQGLVTVTHKRIRSTPMGLRFLDQLLLGVLPERGEEPQ